MYWIGFYVFGLFCSCPGFASGFSPAFQSGDLDLELCIAWQEDIPLKANVQTLRSVLGLGSVKDRQLRRWVGPVGPP